MSAARYMMETIETHGELLKLVEHLDRVRIIGPFSQMGVRLGVAIQLAEHEVRFEHTGDFVTPLKAVEWLEERKGLKNATRWAFEARW